MHSFFGFLTPTNDTLVLDIPKIVGQPVNSATVEISDSADGLAFTSKSILLNGLKVRPLTSDSSIFTLELGPSENSSTSDQNATTDLVLVLQCINFDFIKKSKKFFCEFPVEIKCNNIESLTIKATIRVSLYNELKTSFSKSSEPITDSTASLLLLRTNPKLSGNVKLVVDNDYDLFLDTFKVSKQLNKNCYRHLPISDEGNYPRDIKNAFSSLGKGDLFALPKDSLDTKKNYTSFDDQFSTIYNYGAETNDDFLYPENFKILAPLWIGQTLPDYFVIFRVGSHYNAETYKNSSSIDSTKKLKEFLKDGEVIKTFDLRESTPIGKYLHNYSNKYLKGFNNGCLFLQFNKYAINGENAPLGKNSWYGVSIDSGVMTHKDETCYFMNKSIDSLSQEDLDGFLLDGFERNNMLCGNLLNLEFMFNDEASTDFSMHRYFGLYLKENDLIDYAYIQKDLSNDGKILSKKYDENKNEIDDSYINSLVSKYPEKLFFGTTDTNITRLTKGFTIEQFQSREVSNYPSMNIEASKAEYASLSTYAEFIYLKMIKPMEYGEHIKIVMPFKSRSKEQDIYEIIASNDSRLISSEGVFPYVITNKRVANAFDASAYVRSTKDSSGLIEEDMYTEGDGIHTFPNQINVGFNRPNDTSVGAGIVSESEPYEFSVDVNNGFNSLRYELSRVENYPRVHRLAFYSQDYLDSSRPATIEEQIKRIEACIKKFNAELYVAMTSYDSFTIVTSQKGVTFQHLTREVLELEHSMELEKGFSTETEYSDLVSNYKSLANEDPTFVFFNDAKSPSVLSAPTSFDSMNYKQENVAYAPLDFEMLGWRKSSIVNFIEIPQNAYELSLSSDAIENFNKIIIAKSLENSGHTMLKDFSIKSHLVIHNIDSNAYNNSTSLETIEQFVNFVRSPFTAGKWLVYAEKPLALINGRLNLYLPKPSHAAIMGIMPIKDFDFAYSDKLYDLPTKNMHSITLKRGESVVINAQSDGQNENAIATNVVYTLDKGSFVGLHIQEKTAFIILEEVEGNYKIYYNSKEEKVLGKKLTARASASISVIDNLKFENTSSFPKVQAKLHDLLKMFADKQLGKLKWPVTIPINFKWKSNGNYLDGQKTLEIKNIIGYYNYLSEFGVAPQTSVVGGSYINEYVSTENGPVQWAEALATYAIDKPISKFLSSQGTVDRAKAFYNPYIDTLEFIYFGIKFSINFSTTSNIKNVRLSDYDNYDVVAIVDNVEANKIYISNAEKTILLVIKQSEDTIDYFAANKLINKEKVDAKANYYWQKVPLKLNIDKVYGNDSKVYLHAINESGFALDASICVQTSYFKDSSINYYVNNDSLSVVIPDVSIGTGESRIAISNDGIWCTYPQVGRYGKLKLDTDFSFLTTESVLVKNFASGTDQAAKRVKPQSIIDSLVNGLNTEVYIVNSSSEHTSFTNSVDPIIQIKASWPDRLASSSNREVPLKYNYGYFSPNFVDILEFYPEESSDVVSLTKKSFLNSNTAIKSLNDLERSYGNKVFKAYVDGELGTNLFESDKLSLVSSNWDSHYYKLWDESSPTSQPKEINGYATGIEDKTYFGSKCIVLNDPEIELSNWDYSTNLISWESVSSDYTTIDKALKRNKKAYKVSINLTLALYNYFSYIDTRLRDNFKDFNDITQQVYNNYIKNTLSKFFDIKNREAIQLYSTVNNINKSSESLFSLVEPVDLEKNWKRESNFESTYSIYNGETILTLSLPQKEGKQYYIKLNIKSV